MHRSAGNTEVQTPQPQDVTTLYLSSCKDFSCKPNATFLESIAGKSTHDVTEMNLGGNFFGVKGLLPLIMVLKSCIRLGKLSLCGLRLDNGSFMRLCNAMNKGALVVVDISKNEGLSCDDELCDFVRAARGLQRLDLEGTGFSAATQNIVAHLLSERNERAALTTTAFYRTAAQDAPMFYTPSRPETITTTSHLLEPHRDPLITQNSSAQLLSLSSTYCKSSGFFFKQDPAIGVVAQCLRTGLIFCQYDTTDGAKLYRRASNSVKDMIEDAARQRLIEKGESRGGSAGAPPRNSSAASSRSTATTALSVSSADTRLCVYPDLFNKPSTRFLENPSHTEDLNHIVFNSDLGPLRSQHLYQIVESLSEERLIGLFATQNRVCGVYSIALWWKGVRAYELLDEFCEVDPERLAHGFGEVELSAQHSMWAVLFGRLASKVMSRSLHSRGNPCHIHALLCGGVSFQIALEGSSSADSKDTPLWDLFRRVSGNVASFCMLARPREAVCDLYALHPTHLYSVIKTEELRTEKLVVLDNVFAQGLPLERKEVNPIYEKLLGAGLLARGCVMMPFAEFCDAFDHCTISLEPHENNINVEGEWTANRESEPLWKITLPSAGMVTILLRILPEDTSSSTSTPQPISLSFYSEAHPGYPPPLHDKYALISESSVTETLVLPYCTALRAGVCYVEPRLHAEKGKFLMNISAKGGVEVERVAAHRGWYKQKVRTAAAATSEQQYCKGGESQIRLDIKSDRTKLPGEPVQVVLQSIPSNSVRATLHNVLCIGPHRILEFLPESQVLSRFSSGTNQPHSVTLILPPGSYNLVTFCEAGQSVDIDVNVYSTSEVVAEVFTRLARMVVGVRFKRPGAGDVLKGNPMVRVQVGKGCGRVLLHVASCLSSLLSLDVLHYAQVKGVLEGGGGGGGGGDVQYAPCSTLADTSLLQAVQSSTTTPMEAGLLYQPLPHVKASRDFVVVVRHYPPGVSKPCEVTVLQEGPNAEPAVVTVLEG